MKQKTKQVLIALIALVVLLGGYSYYKSTIGTKGAKEVSIKIVVEDNGVIYDNKVNTDAPTLGELLKEMQENKNILLEYSDSTYGMYIQGMGKEELFSEDPAKGMYWTYTSENNSVCVKNGFCDAADILPIEDGDSFEFTLAVFSY